MRRGASLGYGVVIGVACDDGQSAVAQIVAEGHSWRKLAAEPLFGRCRARRTAIMAR